MAMETAAKDGRMFDMHCHMDFASDASESLRILARRGVGAFSVTVTPRDYERARREFSGFNTVRVGLGLHPWWVADGRCDERDVALFEQLACEQRFIGEVGLDFSRSKAYSRDVQVEAFERVVKACANGGKVLSIHAVRSASEVLDVLGRIESGAALRDNACVFHWFSGTSDELQRAVRVGCLFSVGPRMLASKRGRAYAKTIPVDRLLLETDEPGARAMRYDADARIAELDCLIDDIAALRSTDRNDLAARIAFTSALLLDFEGEGI